MRVLKLGVGKVLLVWKQAGFLSLQLDRLQSLHFVVIWHFKHDGKYAVYMPLLLQWNWLNTVAVAVAVSERWFSCCGLWATTFPLRIVSTLTVITWKITCFTQHRVAGYGWTHCLGILQIFLFAFPNWQLLGPLVVVKLKTQRYNKHSNLMLRQMPPFYYIYQVILFSLTLHCLRHFHWGSYFFFAFFDVSLLCWCISSSINNLNAPSYFIQWWSTWLEGTGECEVAVLEPNAGITEIEWA